MRYLGVHYDTGVHFSPEYLSRHSFDRELIQLEIRAIKESLHANAVRIIGEDIERLRFSAVYAAGLGLSVFLNPWLINKGEEEMLALYSSAAQLAEELREAGGDVMLVLGCEQSLFGAGIIPGADVYDRIRWLVGLREGVPPVPSLERISAQVNSQLRRCVDVVRKSFRGPVTYAAGVWEKVDWSPFDMVGLDYYRAAHTDEEYTRGLTDAAAHGKPVGVLEFGCCTYVGADKKGGMGWMLLDGWRKGDAVWLAGHPPERSEETQARYITDQLDLMIAAGVDAAFVFTFSAPYLTHDPDNPERDYDMCSYGMIKLFAPDTPQGREMPPWKPKKSFDALGQYYARLSRK